MAIYNHQTDSPHFPCGLMSDLAIGKQKQYGHAWYWMSLLRPSVINNTKLKLKPLWHLVFETVSIRFWSLPNLILIFACLVATSCLTRFWSSTYFFTLSLNGPIRSRMSRQVVPGYICSRHLFGETQSEIKHDQTHHQHCHNNLTPIRLNPCYLVISKSSEPLLLLLISLHQSSHLILP